MIHNPLLFLLDLKIASQLLLERFMTALGNRLYRVSCSGDRAQWPENTEKQLNPGGNRYKGLRKLAVVFKSHQIFQFSI
jgi:hypothetical protein